VKTKKSTQKSKATSKKTETAKKNAPAVLTKAAKENSADKELLPQPKEPIPETPAIIPEIVKVTPVEKAIIYIVGESPLVEEYAECCAAHGFQVLVEWDTPQEHTFSSSKIKHISKIPANVSIALELSNMDLVAKKRNIEKISTALANTAPIVSSSINVTATEQSAWINQKHRLVGLAALPSFIQQPLVEIAPTIYSPKETIEAVERFFHSMGKKIEIVQDRVGMVLPRILCQIINEGAFAISEEIASPQDTDLALKQGAQFPFGPIEWAERIGLKQVASVLVALHSDLQEERYRIAPLLRQMSQTDSWWSHENV
jgi:3-hydroxybutyryl-CoA dehydrogenase